MQIQSPAQYPPETSQALAGASLTLCTTMLCSPETVCSFEHSHLLFFYFSLNLCCQTIKNQDSLVLTLSDSDPSFYFKSLLKTLHLPHLYLFLVLQPQQKTRGILRDLLCYTLFLLRVERERGMTDEKGEQKAKMLQRPQPSAY